MPETGPLRIPVSFGEMVDKITILEIKAAKIDDAEKVAHVRDELSALKSIWAMRFGDDFDEIAGLAARLKDTNLKLWEIEDEIRERERARDFGADFIRLARSVYATNDERAAIKREIDVALGSPLREEKSYKPYR